MKMIEFDYARIKRLPLFQAAKLENKISIIFLNLQLTLHFQMATQFILNRILREVVHWHTFRMDICLTPFPEHSSTR